MTPQKESKNHENPQQSKILQERPSEQVLGADTITVRDMLRRSVGSPKKWGWVSLQDEGNFPSNSGPTFPLKRPHKTTLQGYDVHPKKIQVQVGLSWC